MTTLDSESVPRGLHDLISANAARQVPRSAGVVTGYAWTNLDSRAAATIGKLEAPTLAEPAKVQVDPDPKLAAPSVTEPPWWSVSPPLCWAVRVRSSAQRVIRAQPLSPLAAASHSGELPAVLAGINAALCLDLRDVGLLRIKTNAITVASWFNRGGPAVFDFAARIAPQLIEAFECVDAAGLKLDVRYVPDLFGEPTINRPTFADALARRVQRMGFYERSEAAVRITGVEFREGFYDLPRQLRDCSVTTARQLATQALSFALRPERFNYVFAASIADAIEDARRDPKGLGRIHARALAHLEHRRFLQDLRANRI